MPNSSTKPKSRAGRSRAWVPEEIPHALTPLVGRDRELQRLLERLDEARLVTLVGLSGVGKSRLAQGAVATQEAFPGGVGWLEVEAGLGASAIASALTHWKASGGERLLVVDAADGLPPGERRAILAWLRQRPEARCLFTGLRPLGLRDETVMGLPALSVDGSQGFSAAAQYWTAVRRRGDLDWEPTLAEGAEIERQAARVGGLPLAIELLADAPPGTDPFEFVSPHHDTLDRHRSLDAAFAYSWQWLASEERSALISWRGRGPDRSSALAEDLIRLGWLTDGGALSLTPLAEYWLERTETSTPAMSRAVWQVRLFGGCELRRRGEIVPRENWWGKAQRLFAFMALHAGETVARDRLLDTFWPGEDPGPARHRLQTTVSQIRRTWRGFSGELLQSQPSGYVLGADGSCASDLEEARALLAEADRGFPGTAEALDYARRLALWPASALLLEFPHEDWCVLERERYHERWSEVLVRLAEGCGGGGDWREASEIAQSAAREDPCDESACRVLLRAFVRLGRSADAARAYQRCEQALQAEFGLPPSAVTQALFQRVRDAAA